MGYSGLAQHLEVVRQCGLRHRSLHGAARLLLPFRQRTDDLQTDWIAERVQYVWQGYLVDARVVERPHTQVRRLANIGSSCFLAADASPPWKIPCPWIRSSRCWRFSPRSWS